MPQSESADWPNMDLHLRGPGNQEEAVGSVGAGTLAQTRASECHRPMTLNAGAPWALAVMLVGVIATAHLARSPRGPCAAHLNRWSCILRTVGAQLTFGTPVSFVTARATSVGLIAIGVVGSLFP